MNKQVILAERPVGMPDTKTWRIESSPIPSVSKGEILVKVEYISLDPAMRGWMRDVKSYVPPVPLNDVMRAGGVGQIVESKNPHYQKGDYVVGVSGAQQYSLSDGKGWTKVDPNIAPLPKYLGVLGMPGMTAYFGLLDVTNPKEGETVLVSGAAGAVGSIVGQIAKIKGCRVVGIAGGAEKCKHVVENLGFDACIDYKNEDVRQGLKEHCTAGVDVYFDNVGGEILDLALAKINRGARISICGAISQYNNTTPIKGPQNYLNLLVQGAKMEGFVVFHFAKRYPEAAMQLGQWVAEGKIQAKEHIEEGLDNFLDTFSRLFSGEKKGKLVIKV